MEDISGLFESDQLNSVQLQLKIQVTHKIKETLGKMRDTNYMESRSSSCAPQSTKHQMMKLIVEEWSRIAPTEFHTLVESLSRRLLVAQRPYRHHVGVSFI